MFVARVGSGLVPVVATLLIPPVFVAILPRLVVPAMLVAALVSVPQSLVLALVAGEQSAEQLLHVLRLGGDRSGEKQSSKRCRDVSRPPGGMLRWIMPSAWMRL